jgi:hypothetical protein
MLVIGELHNVPGGRGDTRREFLKLLRFLGNELRIALADAGIRDACLVIGSDDQLETESPRSPARGEAGARGASWLIMICGRRHRIRRPRRVARPPG